MAQVWTIRRALSRAAALSVLAMLGAGTVSAQAPGTEGQAELRIDAAPLGEALRSLSAQTGQPVIFSEELVIGLRAGAVRGVFSAEAALRQLLDGTGLEAVAGGKGSFLVRRAPPGRTDGKAGGEERPVQPVPVREPEPPESEPELRAGTVIVTGTSLRGFAPESSPLQVYSREEILVSGVTSTEQFIRTLPQNYGGGSSEFAPGGLPNDFNSARNDTFGTGANIRGLGSGGTLVLLNGNRLAPTSSVGNFVDLSLIPVSALERVDVLTDGASSIYGGDAVAGVMNFVLRDDFEGSETALRYGAVTSGDLSEIRASQTLGTAWSSGNLLATYEYFQRDNLVLEDRPWIAAPVANNGLPIPDPGLFDLLPAQERSSAVVSGRQQFGPLALTGSGLYSIRTADSTTTLAGANVSRRESDSESESVSLSLQAAYDLSARWSASLGGTFGEVRNTNRLSQFTPPQPRPATPTALTATRSELNALDLLINGDLLRLPGGEIKAAFGAHLREESFKYGQVDGRVLRRSARDVRALYAELLLPIIGEDNAAPGFERLELNLSGRVDDYSDFGQSENPKVGLLWSPAKGLNVRGSYSTSFSPPALGLAGDLSRGGTIAPYRVLAQAYGQPVPAALQNTDFLFLSGTALDLQPETSRTFTAGLDYAFDQGQGRWSARATWYDVSFEGRLGQTPIPGNLNFYLAPGIAFDDPSAFPDGTVVFFPDPDEIAAALAAVNLPLNFAFGGSVANIGIINNVNLVRNLASTETSGFDLQLGYSADTYIGQVSAGLNANYITVFDQQAASTTPVVSTLNTFLNPVDLKVRANLGLSRGGWSGNVHINYMDSYRTNDTVTGQPIASWTTADAALSFAPQAGEGSWLRGTSVSLSVINLFDENPPETPTLGTSLISGYDPTNASPLGRFVAVELRKAF